MKMLTIGQRALFESNLVELALPYMRTLRDKWLDTVVFGVMHDDEIVTIENCAGKRLFRPKTRLTNGKPFSPESCRSRSRPRKRPG